MSRDTRNTEFKSAYLDDVRATVRETMNDYLEGAIDVVCSGDALVSLLGDLDGVSGAVLVAGYLQGCARLHAAMMLPDMRTNEGA
jgi:hypothetical protein